MLCFVFTDTDPPEAVSCNGPVSPVTIATGNISAVVSWPSPLFSDNSGEINNIVSNRIPGRYHAGHYVIRTNATDSSGNMGSCSFDFVVQQ